MTGSIVTGLAPEFCLEQTRCELRLCQDTESLRQVSLHLLNLLEDQHVVFAEMMRKDWLL